MNHKVVVSHLTPLILFQQLQNFAKFGNHILVISHFYSSHLLHHQLTNPILQALSAALREYCEYFYVYLSTLANKYESFPSSILLFFFSFFLFFFSFLFFSFFFVSVLLYINDEFQKDAKGSLYWNLKVY